MQESVTYRSILRKGAEQTMREVALRLLHEGVALETIARATQLSIDQIHQIQASGLEPTETSGL